MLSLASRLPKQNDKPLVFVDRLVHTRRQHVQHNVTYTQRLHAFTVSRQQMLSVQDDTKNVLSINTFNILYTVTTSTRRVRILCTWSYDIQGASEVQNYDAGKLN